MEPLNPKDQQDTTRQRPWLLGGVIALCLLLMAALMVAGAMVTPQSDYEYTQAQLLDKTLGVAHDELIMLIISLIVVVQVVANFQLPAAVIESWQRPGQPRSVR